VEPLADIDPVDRPAAKAETPSHEAAAWLADPDAAPKPKRLTIAQLWAIELGLNPETCLPYYAPANTEEDTVAWAASRQTKCWLFLRLRQWAVDHNGLNCGRTTHLTQAGWRERRQSEADARNVRAIDFEKAFATLDTARQHALVLTYREPRRTRCQRCRHRLQSVRTLAYMLPAARRRLADILDRLALL
jgi:hypothetical protein